LVAEIITNITKVINDSNIAGFTQNDVSGKSFSDNAKDNFAKVFDSMKDKLTTLNNKDIKDAQQNSGNQTTTATQTKTVKANSGNTTSVQPANTTTKTVSKNTMNTQPANKAVKTSSGSTTSAQPANTATKTDSGSTTSTQTANTAAKTGSKDAVNTQPVNNAVNIVSNDGTNVQSEDKTADTESNNEASSQLAALLLASITANDIAPVEELAQSTAKDAQTETAPVDTTVNRSDYPATVDVGLKPDLKAAQITQTAPTAPADNKTDEHGIDISKLTKLEAPEKIDPKELKLTDDIKSDTDAQTQNTTENTATNNNNNDTVWETKNDINIESIQVQKTAATEPAQSEQVKPEHPLKTETRPLEVDETLEAVDTTVSDNSLSNSDSGGSQTQQNSEDIKLSVDNLTEKSPFLDSDKSIIFNKVLDNTTAKAVPRSEVMNQINQNLSQLANGNTKVNIVLNPENLGRITIELQSGKDGLVARFTTENPQVKELLDKNTETLKNSLNAQGVNTNNIAIKVESTAESSKNNLQFNNQNFDQNAQTFMQNQTKSTYKSETGSPNEVVKEEIPQENAEITTKTQTNGLGTIDYRI